MGVGESGLWRIIGLRGGEAACVGAGDGREPASVAARPVSTRGYGRRVSNAAIVGGYRA